MVILRKYIAKKDPGKGGGRSEPYFDVAPEAEENLGAKKTVWNMDGWTPGWKAGSGLFWLNCQRDISRRRRPRPQQLLVAHKVKFQELLYK